MRVVEYETAEQTNNNNRFFFIENIPIVGFVRFYREKFAHF